jgi:hypothetical protein
LSEGEDGRALDGEVDELIAGEVARNTSRPESIFELVRTGEVAGGRSGTGSATRA